MASEQSAGEAPPRTTSFRLSKCHESSKRAMSMPQEKRGTYISRLIITLEECLAKLGVTPETHDDLLACLERMACLIHESMSVSSRNYHSVQHVFDVAEGVDADDPIAIIAALFHDCVYYHVDGGLSELQYDKLRGAVAFGHGQVTTHPGENGGAHMPIYEAHKTTPCADDALLCMVEKVFGYAKGQNVNHQNGLNEFLSTVIAVRELESILPMKRLAQIAICIEATIPFRSIDKETGKTCMEKLYDKVVSVNQDFALGLTETEIVQSVQRAADLGNSDVLNFGTKDVFWFLDNTWSLLPESNEGLRRHYLYTVQQFQFAVFKMYGFFCFLQPEVIFPYFQDIPAPEKIHERVTNASHNLQVGRKYVGAKLLSLSVLSAIAELTGGDAPISLFMGDLPSRHSSISAPVGQAGKEEKRKSITRSLEIQGIELEDSNSNLAEDHYDEDVYEVLAKGRRTETSFDVRQSPLAANFYRVLGDDELKSIFTDIKVHPMTPEVAWTFLKRLPRDIVRDVIKNVSHTAISRTDKILKLLHGLPVSS
eukprot:CAMPEP_0172443088 /NCGR_PEP_ID=MMETSP1065-20121228/3402_1 /TAXON_ID=265537 /ORGANISM="Amphiprora paludosa, Strain CCMP125" /LENGTH=538 /DNA_ID=CAMNT_0013193183 /DNA_START=65 /DNA_END=1681 /DNA_ORIENTATION=+